jgi:hypothetical protein
MVARKGFDLPGCFHPVNLIGLNPLKKILIYSNVGFRTMRTK